MLTRQALRLLHHLPSPNSGILGKDFDTYDQEVASLRHLKHAGRDACWGELAIGQQLQASTHSPGAMTSCVNGHQSQLWSHELVLLGCAWLKIHTAPAIQCSTQVSPC